MSAADVVDCMLTALFVAAALRSLRQAVLFRSQQRRGRVDHLLHAVMALAMAVMPWNVGRMPSGIPQTAFFAAAALWFPLTADRCQGPAGGETDRGRTETQVGLGCRPVLAGWFGRS